MCLLLLAMVPAWAADLPQEVTDAAPPAAEELEGKDFSGGIAALLEQGTTLLGEALRGNLRGAVLILGVVLLCGAADAVLRTPESPMRRFLPMAGAAAIAVLSLGSMKSLLGLGTQTIEELDVFSKALLPTLAAAVAAGETAVNSPMPGNIFKVECSVGQAVKAGDVLVVLEAMKMEIEVSAPVDGTVKAVSAVVGTAVNTDDLLVTIG